MAITTPVKPAPPVRQPRMTLASLVRGRLEKPVRVLLYAPEGIGKSTFASQAPSPVFIGPEDGTAQLDVVRFPQPESWEDILEAVQTLANEPHDFRSIVIDTIDWAEPLLWKHLCTIHKVTSIEDVGGGFGKGYVAAIDGWRSLLSALERLREQRGMHVILLAHSWVRPFRSPDQPDYDRFELKVHQRAGGLIKEWVDAVLFGNYETFTEKDQRTKRVKGISTGARLIYTVRTAAWDAKNRYDLPESLALDWEEFYAAVRAHRPAEPAALVKAIKEKVETLSKEDRERAAVYLEQAGNDAVKLAKLNSWVNGKVVA